MLKFVLSSMLLVAAQPASAQTAQGPLAPGKAAGIHRAESDSQISKFALAGGVGLGVVALYLIVGTHYPDNSKKKSTSGTH
ncbi:MAG TPA: hypothetical protein VLT91_12785 [Rhizomicrobium sp.]|nr:hypothetical protein [Rhizomicrobium sp.]